jgi:hypothetical protein
MVRPLWGRLWRAARGGNAQRRGTPQGGARKLIGTVQPVQPTLVGTIGEALYSSSPVKKYREKSMWSSIGTACSNSPEPRVSKPSRGEVGHVHMRV